MQHQHLTPCEREIIKKLLSGLKVREIAALYKISPRTVSIHKINAMRKVDLVGSPLNEQLAFFRRVFYAEPRCADRPPPKRILTSTQESVMRQRAAGKDNHTIAIQMGRSYNLVAGMYSAGCRAAGIKSRDIGGLRAFLRKLDNGASEEIDDAMDDPMFK